MPTTCPSPRRLTLVMVTVLAVGCGKKNIPDPDSAGPAPPVAGQTGPPLTEKDYQEFGEWFRVKLEGPFVRKDGSGISGP